LSQRGKSFRNFSPIGPAVVSLDLLDDPDDLGLNCDVDGQREQDGRTSDLIFGVDALVEYLSSICELFRGDLVFTGTPAGVGVAKGRFLQAGQTMVSTIEGVGTITNRCVAP
jgi:2,4-diketo-3-deoxy-L-fuconate hydrolase